ncbi:MAG: DUF58 domain-containing protein [Planctomycetes bacterium]|nr:DUF58 domain-containing protein [Planctomycetota bacterium]
MADTILPAVDEEIIATSLMSKLNTLALMAPRSFPGSSAGKRMSRVRGSEGMEFADHKEYSPGDDFRNIDWNVYARLDELVVKNFETEENLRIYVLLDSSASMAFGDPSKEIVSKRIAAALAYMGFVSEDWTGVFSFTDTIRDQFITTGKPKLRILTDFLRGAKPEGKTNFVEAFKAFSIQQARPGLAFILSDFWAAEKLDEALKFLAYNRFCIAALHLLDPLEEDPGIAGDMDVCDLESGETVPLTSRGDTAEQYQRLLKQHCGRVAATFAAYNATYLKISTRDNLEHLLFNTLKRNRLVRQR